MGAPDAPVIAHRGPSRSHHRCLQLPPARRHLLQAPQWSGHLYPRRKNFRAALSFSTTASLSRSPFFSRRSKREKSSRLAPSRWRGCFSFTGRWKQKLFFYFARQWRQSWAMCVSSPEKVEHAANILSWKGDILRWISPTRKRWEGSSNALSGTSKSSFFPPFFIILTEYSEFGIFSSAQPESLEICSYACLQPCLLQSTSTEWQEMKHLWGANWCIIGGPFLSEGDYTFRRFLSRQEISKLLVVSKPSVASSPPSTIDPEQHDYLSPSKIMINSNLARFWPTIPSLCSSCNVAHLPCQVTLPRPRSPSVFSTSPSFCNGRSSMKPTVKGYFCVFFATR
ncbi:Expansin-B3 [Platanthera guangdongensis]|uniref:Expansin-B3 n=1 Tax=Platanthera guangdongensis TaxID=2320717 RepID=A0ABR2N2Q5_9ASPA